MIFYQFLMALALPVVLAHQAVFGPRGAVVERLGLLPAPGPGLRLWLHAAHLRLPHPVTGESLNISSPLPPEWALWKSFA